MVFDYEKSVWGRGTATLNPSDPTSIRLRNALLALKKLKTGKVLEIGCGAGQFIRGIKILRPELECFGSDISKEALNNADPKDGVNYCLQNEKTTSFDDEFFDAVLIFDVLEHVADPRALLNETARVLKRGGILYAFVPCEGDNLSMWRWLRKIGLGQNLTTNYAGHINFFTRKELLDMAAAAGFQTSKTKFSEHFLGQLLGIAVFFAMGRAAKKIKVEQINNELFLKEKKLGLVSLLIRKMVNSLIFVESTVFSGIPSPNIHIFLKKL